MIKGLLSLLGMFGVFQAPKERGKGSEVNCFLEEQTVPIRSQGWAGAPLILLCKPWAPPLMWRPAPQKWRNQRGEDEPWSQSRGQGTWRARNGGATV